MKCYSVAQYALILGVLFLFFSLGLAPVNLDGIAGHYPLGQYTVIYQGQGTIQYLGDATLIQSSTGKDIIQVNPTNTGIRLRITSTNATNYLKSLEKGTGMILMLIAR